MYYLLHRFCSCNQFTSGCQAWIAALPCFPLNWYTCFSFTLPHHFTIHLAKGNFPMIAFPLSWRMRHELFFCWLMNDLNSIFIFSPSNATIKIKFNSLQMSKVYFSFIIVSLNINLMYILQSNISIISCFTNTRHQYFWRPRILYHSNPTFLKVYLNLFSAPKCLLLYFLPILRLGILISRSI